MLVELLMAHRKVDRVVTSLKDLHPTFSLGGGDDLIRNKTGRHNLSLLVKVYTHDLTVIGGLLRPTTIDLPMKISAVDCVSKHLHSRTNVI